MAETTPNSYVDQFALPNASKFDALVKVNGQIALERNSWEQAGAAEEIAQLTLNFYQRWHIGERNLRPSALHDFATSHRASMFGEHDNGNVANYAINKHFTGLPQRARDEFNKIGETMDSHATAFQATIKPIKEEQDNIFGGLLEDWKGYITADVTNLGVFSQFLTSDLFAELRSVQRPFLILLEDRRKRDLRKGPFDLIEAMKRRTIETVTESPSYDTMSAFITKLEARTNNSKTSGNELISWLKFASYPALGVDIDRILTIISSEQFPGSFKASFIRFVDDRVTADASNVRASLSQYKPDQLTKVSFDLSGSVSTKRKGAQVKTNLTTQVSIPERPKVTYILMTGNKAAPSHDEITDFVSKGARVAKTNPKLLDDLIRMVDVLAVDPHLLGVRRLTAHRLFYFSPHENPTFKPTDGRTDRYRAVFNVIDVAEDSPNVRRVVILDVLHHDEFDKKY